MKQPTCLIWLMAVGFVAWTAGAQNTALESFDASTWVIDAGIVEVNIQTGRFERIGDGADVTLKPSTGDAQPIRFRAKEIAFAYASPEDELPQTITFSERVIINHPLVTIESGKAVWSFATNRVVFTEHPVVNSAWVKDGKGERMVLDLARNTFTIEKGHAVVDMQGGESQASQADSPMSLAAIQILDIRDWPAFLADLRAQAVADGPTPGKQVLMLLDAPAREALETQPIEELVTQKPAIVQYLNKVLAQPAFYNPEAWNGITLPPETAALVAQVGDSSDSDTIMERNRLLLEAAFPQTLRSRAQSFSRPDTGTQGGTDSGR